ncbi:hypothetical protein IKB17_06080 [bacterium]|nr:hypothetical protein [bacterium]
MLLNEETVTVLQIFICDSLEATINNLDIALWCGVDGIENSFLYSIKNYLEKLTESQFLQVKSACKKYINQHYFS